MQENVPTSARFPALRSRRAVIVVSSLTLVAGLIAYATTRITAAEPATSTAAATPPAPKVTVAPVEEKFVAEYEELTGHVDAQETVELRARVSGHLEEVRFQA